MKLDLRTREGVEAEILAEIGTHDGYLTVFWITENQKRACAMTRMLKDGRVKYHPDDKKTGYPMNRFMI